MVESVSGVFVPVEVLAREQNTGVEDIIERIQNGALVGRKQSDGWHVMVRAAGGGAASARAPAAEPAAVAPPAPPAPLAPTPGGMPVRVMRDEVGEVVVRDVQIRFSAMVVLLLKFVLACIPVGIILGGIGYGALWLYQRFGADLLARISAVLGGA